MTVERVDLSVGLVLERMAPVSEASAVQGQSSAESQEGKPRRRPPPEEASAEPPPEESEDPQHRIDSLA